MGAAATDAGAWAVRSFVSGFVVGRARPTVRDAYRRLGRRHELVLEADGGTIRMAPPFPRRRPPSASMPTVASTGRPAPKA